MEQVKENATEKVQVIEFEKDGVLLTFDEKAIRELISDKEFWFKHWSELKSNYDALVDQIEAARAFLENVNLYQILTNKK